MKKRLFSILNYIIFLGGGLFLVWWQFDSMTDEQFIQFKSAFKNANYKLIPVIVILALASHISRAARWKILIEPMGYHPSLLNTFGTTMIGYLANSFFPRVGEIIKCTLLGRYEKIPPQKLIGTIIIERIFDVACYIIFIIITVLVQYKIVGGFVNNSLSQLAKNNLGMPLWVKMLIVALVVILCIFTLRFLYKKYSHSRIIQKIKLFFSGLKEGILTIRKLKKSGWFLFHTFFIWSMYLLEIYVGFSAMKEVSHLGWAAACGVLSLATLAMIITPNGLGTFPEAVLLVLALYNINESYGKAFGWLMWTTTSFITLFFGLIFLGLLFYLNKKKTVEIS